MRDSPLELLQLQSAAVTAAADAIVITDRAGCIVWVNPSFSTLTGYELAEAVGRNPRDLVKSGRETAAVYQGMWETILAGKTWRGELVNRRKDGTFYLEAQTITPVRDADGVVAHFIAIKQNLTARHSRESDVVDSELRYRRLFESAKDGILILDARTGMVVDVNPYLIERLGFSREQFLGKAIWELGFFRDIVANRENFAELQHNEYIRYEDKPLETAAGTRIDVEFISNVYLVNNEKVIQCNIRDITARKRAERQLREQSEIIAHSHEGVMIVNLAEVVSLWNRGAEEIFGWTAAEAIGASPEALFGPAYAAAMVTARAAVQRDGFWNGEVQVRTRAGGLLTVDCRITLVRDEAGRARAWLNFLADITEKKLNERIALRAQRIEAIGTLSNGIAHDLNNILAPILMATGILRHNLTESREQELLGMVESSAQRGASIIRQLLTFSRGIEGERVSVQARHLIKEMAGIVRETFPRSITLIEEVGPDLWPIVADATQLHQVLMNLCVNARDAMPSGGTLTMAAKNVQLSEHDTHLGANARNGPYVLLTVRDTGHGIPRAIVDRIFEPFFTTKAIGQGSGLGLSTVVGIIRSHGGFVTVYSEAGQGSVFNVYVPADPSGVEITAEDATCDFPSGAGATLLLVDDEDAILLATRLCLERQGYHVVTARDGQEALRMFQAHRAEIKIVVTDMMMPVMDGLKLARELQRLDPAVRVIASSGLDSTVNAAELKAGVIAEFLSKPYARSVLLTVVGRQLRVVQAQAGRDGPAAPPPGAPPPVPSSLL